VAFEAIHAIITDNSAIKIEEIALTERMVVNVPMVRDLQNIRYRVVLLGVYKKNKQRFFFNPIDDTLLEAGDILLVVGNYMFIKEFVREMSTKDKG
jgi:voltage-gated potassium channel